MAVQLTDRQQEIKRLLDEGKTPGEVGIALGITENAVYQARTRIRKATGKRSSARRTTERKSGSKSGRGRGRSRSRSRAASARSLSVLTPPSPSPTANNTVTQRPMTPLQAIRARKGEIESAVKSAEAAHAEAVKATARAEVALKAARTKVSGELAKLEAAENALTGAKPAPKRRSRSKASSSKNGSGSKQAAQAAAQTAPAPAAPPEPITPDPQAEAELAAAQAASAASQPTPGGEAGFSQEGDGFGEE